MLERQARILLVMCTPALTGALIPAARGDTLTIYEIQYTTSDDGSSPHDGEVVDCVGGIVIGKFAGSRPRVVLQDPAYPDGWGGIQVKDWTGGDLFDNVEFGDWVSLTNMLVEEFRGTTFLEWQTPYSPEFTVLSQDNPLPPPIIVPVSSIPAPLEGPEWEWYVEDHAAELYESMRIVVRDVTVTEMYLGKAVDNYNLQTPEGDDCWAADYMNADVDPWGYHPFIDVGQHFAAVAGVFEQYTRLVDGWDYYQLITLTTADLMILGDGDSDGVVTAADWPRLAECLTGPQCEDAPAGCIPPAWTWEPPGLAVTHGLMMDFDYDGDVDVTDLAELQIRVGAP